MKPDTRRHCHVTNCPKHFCLVTLQTRATHLRTFRRKGNVAEFPGLQRPDISLHPLTLELGQNQYLQPQNRSVSHTLGSLCRSLPDLCFLESSASSYALQGCLVERRCMRQQLLWWKGFIMTRGDGSCVDNSFLIYAPKI